MTFSLLISICAILMICYWLKRGDTFFARWFLWTWLVIEVVLVCLKIAEHFQLIHVPERM